MPFTLTSKGRLNQRRGSDKTLLNERNNTLLNERTGSLLRVIEKELL